MVPDTSSLQTVTARIASILLGALSWLVAKTVRVAHGTVWLASGLRSVLAHTSERARDALTGPVKERIAGPLRDVLVGRRLDVSLLVVLLAPVFALASAWWVGSTVDYATLEGWVRGTWYGTDPVLAVFLAVAGLLALGTISAALNSGLVPTTVLVAAPIFGMAVTRYGTGVTYNWGTTVVSLPDAVGVAGIFALAFGVPIAICGFLLGSGLRRITGVLVGGSGRSSRPEQA
jgi:hypothetical protein